MRSHGRILKLCTPNYPLDQITEAFAMAESHEGMRVVIEP
jgi:hypothetical protein